VRIRIPVSLMAASRTTLKPSLKLVLISQRCTLASRSSSVLTRNHFAMGFRCRRRAWWQGRVRGERGLSRDFFGSSRTSGVRDLTARSTVFDLESGCKIQMKIQQYSAIYLVDSSVNRSSMIVVALSKTLWHIWNLIS
jgi:hypothetical protein